MIASAAGLCFLVLPFNWTDGASADQQQGPVTTSTPVVEEPELDSGLYVTAVDANTIEISLPDDVDETSEDSLQD